MLCGAAYPYLSTTLLTLAVHWLQPSHIYSCLRPYTNLQWRCKICVLWSTESHHLQVPWRWMPGDPQRFLCLHGLEHYCMTWSAWCSWSWQYEWPWSTSTGTLHHNVNVVSLPHSFRVPGLPKSPVSLRGSRALVGSSCFKHQEDWEPSYCKHWGVSGALAMSSHFILQRAWGPHSVSAEGSGGTLVGS